MSTDHNARTSHKMGARLNDQLVILENRFILRHFYTLSDSMFGVAVVFGSV